MVGGTASRLANDELLEMRSYMNEGGNVLYTGKRAGVQYQDLYLFDPVENAPCGSTPEITARCQTLSSDFLQYYLGAYLFNDGGGLDQETGEPFPIHGLSDAVRGPRLHPQRRRRRRQPGLGELVRDHQQPAARGAVPAVRQRCPRRVGRRRRRLVRAGRRQPVHVLAAGQPLLQAADPRRSTCPAGGATLTFQTSYDLELDFDYMFVEAHTVGQDDWTTLPDANGHTPGHRDQLHRRLDARTCTRSSTTTRR